MGTFVVWIIAVLIAVSLIKQNPVVGWTLLVAFLFWWFYKQPMRIVWAIVLVNLYLLKVYPIAGIAMLIALALAFLYGYKKSESFDEQNRNQGAKVSAGVAAAASAAVVADVMANSAPSSDVDIGGFDF